MKRFSIIWFVAGFMVGALCVGAWLGSGSLSLPESFASPAFSGAGESASQALPESGAVSIVDQPAGDTVTIESVTVPPPGVWVAVRDVRGGELGNVLGAARVTGPRSNFSVSLLRSTVSNVTYAVELYRDDGGDTFDLAHDSVYVDFATGMPVISYFHTK